MIHGVNRMGNNWCAPRFATLIFVVRVQTKMVQDDASPNDTQGTVQDQINRGLQDIKRNMEDLNRTMEDFNRITKDGMESINRNFNRLSDALERGMLSARCEYRDVIESTECPVCLEILCNPQNGPVVKTQYCWHHAHEDCMTRWHHEDSLKRCPVCTRPTRGWRYVRHVIERPADASGARCYSFSTHTTVG